MQGAFDFHQNLPARPKRPERLFFALFSDGETSARAAQTGRRLLWENRLRATLLRPERLHISLHHVGDYGRLREGIVYAARAAGEAVSFHPFEVTLRSIQSFETRPPINGCPRRYALVLRAEGDALPELHRSLGTAMAGIGFRTTEHFTPHMTVSYVPWPVPRQEIEPIRFVVDAFFLVHSRLRLTQYVTLGRWLLHG